MKTRDQCLRSETASLDIIWFEITLELPSISHQIAIEFTKHGTQMQLKI